MKWTQTLSQLDKEDLLWLDKMLENAYHIANDVWTNPGNSTQNPLVQELASISLDVSIYRMKIDD